MGKLTGTGCETAVVFFRAAPMKVWSDVLEIDSLALCQVKDTSLSEKEPNI